MGRSDSAARAWQALFAGCCFGWLAAGCATVHAPAGDHPGPMATPSTGSATGWISGDVAKRVRRSAAISAGISALSAGSVSYYMDVQEAKLRQVLQGSGVGVIRSGNEITLNLPEAPSFAADSADLTPSFAGILDSLSAVLKKYDKTVIEVAGHTDSSGPHAQNQSLTERRAAVVAAFWRVTVSSRRGSRRSALPRRGRWPRTGRRKAAPATGAWS